MTSLVVGASGATGRLLVAQLLDRGQNVRVIVRSPDSLPEAISRHDRLTMIHASILDLSADEMAQHVAGCTAVASCLGHTLSWEGIYGHPRRLVTDATIRLCNAIKSTESSTKTKFVLMNTAANSNRDLHEPIPFGQKCVIGLLRLLLPPHVDNERAADHLRLSIGPQDKALEWVVVRPDTLTDEAQVTEYEVHASPTRSTIFNAGTSSRINVAHFMADLITESDTWNQWKGRMPVIYNRALS
jgi:nucleoside-diphosphate-sugar epimerase